MEEVAQRIRTRHGQDGLYGSNLGTDQNKTIWGQLF